MPPVSEPQRHAVVFDCNVYLDIADLLGPPFTWEKFEKLTASLSGQPVPHPTNRALDSLRSVAVTTSGRFVGREILEVWSSEHIERTMLRKATSPVVPDALGHRGLGWTPEEADSLMDLIERLEIDSNGGTVSGHYPDGNPPLDHEDGMVYGACRWLAGDDPLCRVYCVTRDRGFLRASQTGQLASHTVVLTPTRFLQLVRASRAAAAARKISG